ncbi:MAG TPA: thiamine pyrophosphate-dependent enzyme [Candidatus Cloacimonadota bacterium]|nr:thiamine pyrophosphate-dependent enzyme [Candidatus Cloacimonadota bacterium]HQB40850.1 thiamine pyrophosphate-dependent enzyme [Candidatus Cloacimonadota bacterium]
MKKLLLLGDEAFAQGALDAGISGAYGYPGTPSTEIIEYIQKNPLAKERNVHREWSANEKTAMETALGMSYAGKRAIVTMKHVGLNVAADPYVNSAFTGANGGLLVTVADDPSMHSSQNEQDSRFFAKFALLPALEPSNQQEAYDMAHYGLELSEKYALPVMIRFVTRLSHSRSGVARQEVKAENTLKLPEDKNQFVLLPAIARRKFKALLAKQADLEKESENSPFNKYIDGKDKSLGIIACGLAHNYLMENFTDKECSHPILKISQYPIPRKMVEKISMECDTLLVLEDGAPLVEEMLKGYLGNALKVKGRLDGTVPRDGELNPNSVAKALGFKETELLTIPEIVAPRPPALCVACPHIDSYNALNEALSTYEKGHVFADIGCYTLGFLPPYQAINSCVDMGASITMAKGAADAGLYPAVGVIGDSTFTHSGITGLLDCVNEKSNVVIIILDNHVAAMTGGQESSAFGRIEQICLGLGVEREHIRTVVPLKKNHEELVKVYREELAYNGVSVIVPRRECVQTMAKRNRSGRE